LTRLTRPIYLLLLLLLAGCATTPRAAPLSGEAAAYQRDVAMLTSEKFEGRGAGTGGNEMATAWLVERFREIGLRPAFSGSYLQGFALADGTVVNNVGGYIPGTLPGAGAGAGAGPAEAGPPRGPGVIIVGAHLDHLGYGERDSFSYVHAIHPGADDNASGVAGLLLLARRYAQRIADDSASANRPAILFVAFNAEEWKMAGSKYFVSHLNETRWGKSQIIAMVNMDMIGRLRGDMLYVFGLDTSPQWADRLARATAGAKSTLRVRTFGTANTASDQQPFAEAGNPGETGVPGVPGIPGGPGIPGVPVLQFFTGKHEDYHRITDTAEKINSEGAVRVVDVVDRVISDF